jgi:iron uptake system component EfeO
MRVPKLAALLAVIPLVLAVAACGDDDGSDVRQVGSDGGSASGSASGSGSGSGSASGSASGSGSGSGIATTGLETTSSDPLIQAAVADYTTYVNGQVDEIIARTTTFTDAVRAGNLAAAKAAYAPSREPWERIEPIAGLIPDIDGAVDARVDDFAGPDDPTWTGWHRLEYLLWNTNTTQGAARFANGLDQQLQRLKAGMATLEIPPAAVALGASELIQEVSEGKITGEEDRYSKTDLWDFAANVEGAEEVIDTLEPALANADPELLARIQSGFDELDAGLAELEKGDGYVLYCQQDDPFPSPKLCPQPTVTKAQIDQLKVQLAGLSEDLALVPGALGLS